MPGTAEPGCWERGCPREALAGGLLRHGSTGPNARSKRGLAVEGTRGFSTPTIAHGSRVLRPPQFPPPQCPAPALRSGSALEMGTAARGSARTPGETTGASGSPGTDGQRSLQEQTASRPGPKTALPGCAKRVTVNQRGSTLPNPFSCRLFCRNALLLNSVPKPNFGEIVLTFLPHLRLSEVNHSDFFNS